MASTKQPPAAIYEARESFVGEVDGEILRVTKGDLIEAGHPAIRKWPQLFQPLSVRFRAPAEARIEQATAAPGEKRGA